MPTQSVIEAGKGAMLRKGKNLKYICVAENKQEKMDNFFFSCNDMINKSFGTAFKVVNKKNLEVINPIQVEEHRSEYEKLANEEETNEETRDNRGIVDSAETQKLDKETIMGFREDGMTGEKIIENLIENSSTFKDRTEFSQAKYLKKKEKKYLQHFVALRPTARLLCQMYFHRAPDKILDIRPDTLAQILTWSNVQSGSNILLAETCKGLIAGAVMERLGNEGSVLQIHQGNIPQRTITEQFNFSIEDVDRLACSFPMEKLDLLSELQEGEYSRDAMLERILGRNYVQDPKVVSTQAKTDKDMVDNVGNNVQDPKVVSTQVKTDKDIVDNVEMVEEEVDKEIDINVRKRKYEDESKDKGHTKAPRVSYLSKEKRIAECERAMKMLTTKNFDSLIIATKYHPKKLLLTLLPYLQIACPFVVYCQYQEPLMECFVTLREMKCVTNLEVTETWYRNLQVLSNRTHPEIVMSATGGFILRGIKVAP